MKTLALYRPFTIGKALEDFDRYMDAFFGQSALTPALQDRRLPAVDIRETPEGYCLEADLPGYDEKDIQIHLDGNVLTIETERQETRSRDVTPEGEAGKQGAEEDKGRYLVRERRTSSFRRSFQLPEDTDANDIQAHFKNGVLRLEVKKRPEVQKRRIEIGSGN